MKKTLAILLLTGATFLTGCGDSQEDFVFTNNNGVISAPVCVDDAYATNSNAALTVNAATGVAANDTLNGATLTFAATSVNGGTIAGNADGSFTYTPAVDFSGTDTFTYTLGNSGGVVTCTVTITVNAVNGFFVDAANGDDGTGSFTNGLPFATIQQALLDAPAGSDIVVRAGNYTGTITLENGDRLLGAGSVLAQGAAVRPVLTGPINLADGNTVDFVRIEGTAGDAIDGNGQNGGIITNCEIANTTGGVTASPIELVGVSGTWNVSNNTIDDFESVGIDVRSAGSDTLTVTLENNTISNGDLGAILLVSEGSSTFTAFVTRNTFSGNNTTVGDAFELNCDNDSVFCLDLEENTSDDTYLIAGLDGGTAVLNIEQVNDLTTAQPAGPGNTGTVDILGGVGFFAPTDRADGFCSQP